MIQIQEGRIIQVSTDTNAAETSAVNVKAMEIQIAALRDAANESPEAAKVLQASIDKLQASILAAREADLDDQDRAFGNAPIYADNAEIMAACEQFDASVSDALITLHDARGMTPVTGARFTLDYEYDGESFVRIVRAARVPLSDAERAEAKARREAAEAAREYERQTARARAERDAAEWIRDAEWRQSQRLAGIKVRVTPQPRTEWIDLGLVKRIDFDLYGVKIGKGAEDALAAREAAVATSVAAIVPSEQEQEQVTA